MRVVFMGTPDIAATCLKQLVDRKYDVVGVYTKIDQPKGRHMKLTMSDVKQYALSQQLCVYQPTTFKDDAVVEELRSLKPDVIAVVAYGKILPQSVLDIPRLGCINIHASILPQLRGSGPVQWSILNGFDQTGVTAMFMSAALDAGDIIEIRKTPIEPYETAQDLLDRLAVMGADLLCDTLENLQKGTYTRTPQNESEVTLAPMLTKSLCPIDWNNTQRRIIDQVRGLNPWPVATAVLDGTKFKVYEVRPADDVTDKAPGSIISLTKQGLIIACAEGKSVVITRLQAEGGKQMAAADYFRGHPIEI